MRFNSRMRYRILQKETSRPGYQLVFTRTRKLMRSLTILHVFHQEEFHLTTRCQAAEPSNCLFGSTTRPLGFPAHDLEVRKQRILQTTPASERACALSHTHLPSVFLCITCRQLQLNHCSKVKWNSKAVSMLLDFRLEDVAGGRLTS